MDSVRALRIYLDLGEKLYTAEGLEVSCEFPIGGHPVLEMGYSLGAGDCEGSRKFSTGFCAQHT